MPAVWRYHEITPPKGTPVARQRLTRDLDHSMLGGVCAGIAATYDFDVTLVRVVTVLLGFATGGFALPVYLVAWLTMPRAEEADRTAYGNSERVNLEMREVSERLVEAGRVLADKTREAAEEIAAIARRERTGGASSDRATTETPPATGPMTDTSFATDDMPEGKSEPESPSNPPTPPTSAWQAPSTPPAPPSTLPPAMSEQTTNPSLNPHVNPPPAGPAGTPPPLPPTPPVPPSSPAP